MFDASMEDIDARCTVGQAKAVLMHVRALLKGVWSVNNCKCEMLTTYKFWEVSKSYESSEKICGPIFRGFRCQHFTLTIINKHISVVTEIIWDVPFTPKICSKCSELSKIRRRALGRANVPANVPNVLRSALNVLQNALTFDWADLGAPKRVALYIELHLEHVFFSSIQDVIISQGSRPKQKAKMDNSGQIITYAGCIDGERQENRGDFSPLFDWTIGCSFYTSQNAIQTLSLPPNTPHHTFTQTQVPRHHHNISKHCPHSPTRYSHIIIINHHSIPTYVSKQNTINHCHTASIQHSHLLYPNHFTKTMYNICAPERDTLPLLSCVPSLLC